MERTKGNVFVETWKATTGGYSIRIYWVVNGIRQYHTMNKFGADPTLSKMYSWPDIKNFLKSKNIECPNVGELDFRHKLCITFNGYGQIID